MNNFIGKIFKKLTNNENENKAKEEEDLPELNNFTFEVENNKDETLDKLVSDIVIRGEKVHNWGNYKKILESMLNEFKSDADELDLRYRLKMKLNVKTDATNIEKMKDLGKIGDSITYLDTSTMKGNCFLSYNKLKLNSKNSFVSIKTNNCVIGGKWIYEITLNTNKLSQMGWCQLKTEFNTQNGVGDDLTSYAYDGYRNCIWHRDRKTYGELWNVGDVIGCGIDLEEKKIEYFLNGKSLGIAFSDIPIGENIAYFPGISLTSDEKNTFNFGRTKFFYDYPNYNSYDFILSNVNGLNEITSEILRLLSTNFFKRLSKNDILPYYKMTLTNKIFNFLANVSFNDDNVLKNVIIPFLYTTQNENKDYIRIFFEYIYIYLDSKQKNIFNLNFFDNLFNMIEENAIRGGENFPKWNSLIDLVLNMFEHNFIIQGWVETNNFIENLRCIFNVSMIKLSDIYKHLREKYADSFEPKPLKKILREIHREHLEKYLKKNESMENLYSEKIIELLLYFLKDKRSFFVKNQNKSYTLKACMGEFVNNGHEFYMMQDFMMNIFNNAQKDYSCFHKNFIFNLVKMHLKNMSNRSLDMFNIEPWFSRSLAESAYHDEVGVGGTINHVTTEYIHNIDKDLLEKNEDFHNEINHRLIKVFSNILIPSMTDYKRKLDGNRSVNYNTFKEVENGTDTVDKTFRYFFYVFDQSNQDALYQYAYFLLKWMNQNIRKNKNILYFIPKNLMEIPFEIIHFLYCIKSASLGDSERRKKLNKISPLFEEDNLIYEIVYFYTYLFNDNNIANPEIRDSLLLKMKFFMSKKKIGKYYEKYYDLIELLIKGILNYMSNENYCLTSCEIIIKIIKPVCFGPKGFSTEKNPFFNVAQKFFETNKTTFLEFMDSYSKIMNRAMTEYSANLNEAETKILSTNQILSNNDKIHYMKRFNISYGLLCDLMKIFEFMLIAYSKELFEIKSINFSRFANFIKNLSSRILDKFYLEKLMKIIEKMNQQNISIEINSLIYSVLGLFLNIQKNSNTENYLPFVKKISNLSDFDCDPFFNLLNIIREKEFDKDIKIYVDEFGKMLEFFITMREKKRERTMSTEEWEETNNNENICIICYANQSDMVMKPCGHFCCNECLMQYLNDKKTSEQRKCFICQAEIDHTEEKVDKKKSDKMDIN